MIFFDTMFVEYKVSFFDTQKVKIQVQNSEGDRYENRVCRSRFV